MGFSITASVLNEVMALSADPIELIQIAEILHKDRVRKNIDLYQVGTFLSKSAIWQNNVCRRLLGEGDIFKLYCSGRIFNFDLLSPDILILLGEENRKKTHPGIVESYIYHKIKEQIVPLSSARDELDRVSTSEFSISRFLSYFQTDSGLKKYVDIAYEIAVVALFETLTKHLNSTVQIKLDRKKENLSINFGKFTRIFSDLAGNTLDTIQPARLFRFGTTNAANVGLDMWANFGPAVQVKHITLDVEEGKRITEEVMADKIIIVCKHAEQKVIESIVSQVGLKNKIRGFITEKDLISWYKLCMTKYANSIGKDALYALSHEFDVEFPLAKSSEIEKFLKERGYSRQMLQGIWALPD